MNYNKLLRSIMRIILYREVFFLQSCDNGRAQCEFWCDALVHVVNTLARKQSRLSNLKCVRD
jgi:hypothetical protein